MNHSARLALADGTVFYGTAFGAVNRQIAQTAEVVFNTSMCGYQEAITDPSYTGQILVFTAPLIGNTGVNEEDLESAKVQVAGVVVRELARLHSNFRSTSDLGSYLARNNTLGISGIDTRALTKRLRTTGAIAGIVTDISPEQLSDRQLVEAAKNAPSMAGQNLVPFVGCATTSKWTDTLGDWSPDVASGPDRPLRVLALDCGAKRNILRNLADRGCEVTVVPHDITGDTIKDLFRQGKVDGLFISNGPGDPAAVDKTIATLREVISDTEHPIPTFGICLGHQLLSLALGATTYKLKFGHRGANQPVLNQITGRVEITSQNHGFAVDPDSLAAVTGGKGQSTHINLNDHTLAGFCLTDRPVFAVQHHPEASPGPHDSTYLFDAFVEMMKDRKPLSRSALQAVQARRSVQVLAASTTAN